MSTTGTAERQPQQTGTEKRDHEQETRNERPRRSRRTRSTIKFPYGDLDDAIEMARVIHDTYGGEASDDQVAARLDQSANSGSFRAKVATTITFGVAERLRDGKLSLTKLGEEIVDPRTEAQARVDAFMKVPLYLRVYEKHVGGRLPGDEGLEAEMEGLGVSPKQTSKARQAFQRSAEQAGMFSQGNDRLVIPPLGDSETADVDFGDDLPRPPGNRATSTPTKYVDAEVVDHPLIIGLWKMLPSPQDGPNAFPPERQKQWLEAARVNLALLYGMREDLPPRHGAADEPLDES